jgi:hypothetical protein
MTIIKVLPLTFSVMAREPKSQTPDASFSILLLSQVSLPHKIPVTPAELWCSAPLELLDVWLAICYLYSSL